MVVIGLVGAQQAPLLARPYYAGGDPGPIVGALAHVPELLEVAIPFVGIALGPSAVPVRTKELVIVRTSAVLECRYCLDTHSVVALDAGLSVEEVAALRGAGPLAGAAFPDAGERLLLAWVDAVAGGRGPVASGLRAATVACFGPADVVELTMLVGATMMLNRFCTALDLPVAPATTARLADSGLAWSRGQ